MSNRRTIADFPRNEAGLVDEFIGTAYDTVKEVNEKLPEIQRLDDVLAEIPTLAEKVTQETIEAAMPGLQVDLDEKVSAAVAQVDVKVAESTAEFDTHVEVVTGQFNDTVEQVEELVVAAGEAKTGAEAAKTSANQSAVTSTTQANLAQQAAIDAQAAADAANMSAGIFPNIAAGLLATTNGQYFSVLAADDLEYAILYLNSAGTAVEKKRYPSSEMVAGPYDKTKDVQRSLETEMPFAVMDDGNNAALGVNQDGLVMAQDLQVDRMRSADSAGLFSLAFTDSNGFVALGIDLAGNVVIPGLESGGSGEATSVWKTLKLGTDDSIVHVGDSLTAAHYVVKDKAYISQLSQLSPFRHMNFGVSGNDLLDMQYRAVNGITTTGQSLKAMNAKYAFITSWTNDVAFRNVDLSFFGENLRRMVDTLRAFGCEPIITSQFTTAAADLAYMARIAEEMGCEFIDCTIGAREVGGLQRGPFTQGPGTLHTGTRSGGVFWNPMLDFIDRMPKPQRAIKIFRKRSTFSAATAADLLYSDRLDKSKKWKELSLFHFSLNPEAKYEELDQLTINSETFAYFTNQDEYQQIARGTAVSFTDFTLLEITLPGGANSLDAIELELGVVGSPEVLFRNVVDIPASMPGKNQGSTPTDPIYLGKWNKPRGAWKSVGTYAGKIVLNQAALSTSMFGNTLQVLLVGPFSMNALEVRYQGLDSPRPLARKQKTRAIGPNLQTQSLCGTPAQLADWVVQGTPVTLVPIDNYNSPRKAGENVVIDGVCEISATDTIGQQIAIPAVLEHSRKYRVTVWCRYFPKAFLRPSVYPTLDTSQILDREAFPNSAPITANTLDLRTLKCEMWIGSNYPAAGGGEFFDHVPLQWRPVSFVYEALPYVTGSVINYRLSCPDGKIQVGKVLFEEIA